MKWILLLALFVAAASGGRGKGKGKGDGTCQMPCRKWTRQDYYKEGELKEYFAMLDHLAVKAIEQHQALSEILKRFEPILNGTESRLFPWIESLNIEIPPGGW